MRLLPSPRMRRGASCWPNSTLPGVSTATAATSEPRPVAQGGGGPAHRPPGTHRPDEGVDPAERVGQLGGERRVGGGVVRIGVLRRAGSAGDGATQSSASRSRRACWYPPTAAGSGTMSTAAPRSRIRRRSAGSTAGSLTSTRGRPRSRHSMASARPNVPEVDSITTCRARAARPPGPVEDVPGRQQLHQAEGGAEQIGPETNDAGQFQRPGDRDGHVPQESLPAAREDPTPRNVDPLGERTSGARWTGRLTAEGLSC